MYVLTKTCVIILEYDGKKADMFDELELTQFGWRGAAAYHLLFLAHNHLLEGRTHDALITSLKLTDYDDIIPCEQIYCLLAVSSCLDKSFGISSRAFIKLESLEVVKMIIYSFIILSLKCVCSFFLYYYFNKIFSNFNPRFCTNST